MCFLQTLPLLNVNKRTTTKLIEMQRAILCVRFAITYLLLPIIIMTLNDSILKGDCTLRV